MCGVPILSTEQTLHPILLPIPPPPSFYFSLPPSLFPPPLTIFLAFSSLAWAFICCTSIVSSLLRRMYRSWFPIHNCIICGQEQVAQFIWCCSHWMATKPTIYSSSFSNRTTNSRLVICTINHPRKVTPTVEL